jgi:hypothetical protein
MSHIPVDLFDDKGQLITLAWDKNEAKEVEAARRRFEGYLEKGLIAFAEMPDGKKIRVYSFDPKYQKITLARLAEGG